MSASYDIRTVEYLGGYRLRLTFADGVVGELDLSSKFEGSVGPVFEPLRDQEFFAKVRPTSLIKRFASPDEVASLVTYVASPLTSAITGAALRVDGGVIKSAF